MIQLDKTPSLFSAHSKNELPTKVPAAPEKLPEQKNEGGHRFFEGIQKTLSLLDRNGDVSGNGVGAVAENIYADTEHKSVFNLPH